MIMNEMDLRASINLEREKYKRMFSPERQFGYSSLGKHKVIALFHLCHKDKIKMFNG